MVWLFLFIVFIVQGAENGMAQSTYQTIGPGSCGAGKNHCHSAEESKSIDKHRNAIDNMIGSDNVNAYAEKAGIDPKLIIHGKSICMGCHGTVVSGKEVEDVEEGVSCESCHGPGSGYKEPHTDSRPDEKKGDPNRSGYTQALSLGLVNLKNVTSRAEACVRCHYITDQSVLAAGHPDGSKFNYLAGMKSVAKHWVTHPITDADMDKETFRIAKYNKGTTGQVRIVNVPAPAASPPSTDTENTLTNVPILSPPTALPSSPDAVPLSLAPVHRMKPPASVAPVAPVALPPPPPPLSLSSAPVAPIDLPPFPTTDGKNMDEVLMILKKRIDLLYEKTK